MGVIDQEAIGRVLGSTGRWPVDSVAAAVLSGGRLVGSIGDPDRPFALASVSKLITAWAALVAVEEGTVDLDGPAGPPGATLRHLLAHAAGFGFEGDAVAAPPARRRIYSNTGYDTVGSHIARLSGIEFAVYVREAVVEPLGMAATVVTGSPAKDYVASLSDLVRFAAELQRPVLLSTPTVTEARTPQFADLAGIVPGIGRFDPCPWGLGPELRGHKDPHWTARENHPETFGHFGGSGTFLWVDPVVDLAVVALTDRAFGSWALEAWPAFSGAILQAANGAPT